MSEPEEKPDDLETRLVDVVRRDGRYPLEAFAFLYEGLNRAVRQVHGETEEPPEAEDPSEPPPSRHVSGQQLCLALRDEAVERWGLLARTVLARWNIRTTIDFGNMVFLLTDNGLMQKTEEDSIEHFCDVFDFDEAFAPGRVFEAGA